MDCQWHAYGDGWSQAGAQDPEAGRKSLVGDRLLVGCPGSRKIGLNEDGRQVDSPGWESQGMAQGNKVGNRQRRISGKLASGSEFRYNQSRNGVTEVQLSEDLGDL